MPVGFWNRGFLEYGLGFAYWLSILSLLIHTIYQYLPLYHTKKGGEEPWKLPEIPEIEDDDQQEAIELAQSSHWV